VVKWFFVYKWLELKEQFERHSDFLKFWGVFFGMWGMWCFVLVKFVGVSNVDTGVLFGLLCTIGTGVLVVCGALVWEFIKKNIEKARNAAKLDISGWVCSVCGGDLRKGMPNVSWGEPTKVCDVCEKSGVKYEVVNRVKENV